MHRKTSKKGGFTTNLVHWLLPSTTSDPDTVDNVSLLCLEAHSTGLVRTARAHQSHNTGELSELPAPYTQKETKDIALLLLPELLDVLHTENAT